MRETIKISLITWLKGAFTTRSPDPRYHLPHSRRPRQRQDSFLGPSRTRSESTSYGGRPGESTLREREEPTYKTKFLSIVPSHPFRGHWMGLTHILSMYGFNPAPSLHHTRQQFTLRGTFVPSDPPSIFPQNNTPWHRFVLQRKKGGFTPPVYKGEDDVLVSGLVSRSECRCFGSRTYLSLR